jgi:hypothetical protein
LRREFPGQGAENTAETCQQGGIGAQILRVDRANTGTPSRRRLAVGSRASEQTPPRCHPRPSPVSASQGLPLPLAESRPFLRCRAGFRLPRAVLLWTVYGIHSTAPCVVQFGAQRHRDTLCADNAHRSPSRLLLARDMHNSCMLPVRVRFTRPWRDEGWV